MVTVIDRTVATLPDAQGVGLATVANVLGRAAPSMTAREYLGRESDTSTVAEPFWNSRGGAVSPAATANAASEW